MYQERNHPEVTILMPVYNGIDFLRPAIESILNQTFRDIELLIINDGSSDGSYLVIEEYAKKDGRVVYVINEKNIGLVRTLNKGIEISRGKYIARMDCDDISDPERIEEQISFMRNNPDVGVCGTWFRFVGDAPSIEVKNPVAHEDICSALLFFNPIAHPTVMLRKDVLVKNNMRYDFEYKNAEDFDLWTRIATITKIQNIPKVLLSYRIRSGSVTQSGSADLGVSVKKIFQRQLSLMGMNCSSDMLGLHRKIGNKIPFDSKEECIRMKRHLEEIYKNNSVTKVYPKDSLNEEILKTWFHLCFHSTFYKRKLQRFFKYMSICMPLSIVTRTFLKISTPRVSQFFDSKIF